MTNRNCVVSYATVCGVSEVILARQEAAARTIEPRSGKPPSGRTSREGVTSRAKTHDTYRDGADGRCTPTPPPPLLDLITW